MGHESEGKWIEVEVTRREHTSWQLLAEKTEENSRKILNQGIWWNDQRFEMGTFIIQVRSVTPQT